MISSVVNPAIGIINQFLESVGREPVTWLRDPDTALFAVAATTIWQNLGITFIIMIAGLQSIPDDLYESARVDGASAWMQFRHVTIPMLSPTIMFASVILSINAFQSFGTPETHSRPTLSTMTSVSSRSGRSDGSQATVVFGALAVCGALAAPRPHNTGAGPVSSN